MRSDRDGCVVAAPTAGHVAGAAPPLLTPGLAPPPSWPPPDVGQPGAPAGGRQPLEGAAEVSGQPGQLPRPPVGDAVPGELGQHQQEEAQLQDDQPEHVVAPGAAHLLVVQVEEGAVALLALHLLRVQDDGAELLQELLDLLDVVAVAGPGVASKEINLDKRSVIQRGQAGDHYLPPPCRPLPCSASAPGRTYQAAHHSHGQYINTDIDTDIDTHLFYLIISDVEEDRTVSLKPGVLKTSQRCEGIIGKTNPLNMFVVGVHMRQTFQRIYLNESH